MAVDTFHKEYDANRYKWQRCRDVIQGRDALIQQVKYGAKVQYGAKYAGSLYNPDYTGNDYLPRLLNQTDPDYIAYQERAGFFNATGRTLDAFTGMIFSKDPTYKLPTAIEAFADDITLSGTNLREFSEQLVEQQIAVGRVGIMVDYPSNTPTNLTVAVAEALNVRPFLRWYSTESIINWRTSYINGAETLTLVVLREASEVYQDEFVSEEVIRYRVLDLTEQGYRVRIINDNNELLEEVFPLQQGKPMRYIPFTVLGANSASTTVQKPPLLDLVDTNLAHYRNSADYEHGLHFTGLPTPYVAGVQLAEGQTLSIGSMTAWVFPDPSAKAEYLEFKGDGLKTLQQALKDKEQRMAVLGARMLADDKRTAEAFGTLELRTAGERSVLASISRSASDAIQRSLNWMAEWVGAPQDVEFSLNTDFGAARMAPQMVTALLGAYQNDAMPLSVLFDNFQRGELINPQMEYEEYEAQLADAGPSFTQDVVYEPDAQNADAEAEQSLISNIRQRLGL
jgi:hypothetical protein